MHAESVDASVKWAVRRREFRLYHRIYIICRAGLVLPRNLQRDPRREFRVYHRIYIICRAGSCGAIWYAGLDSTDACKICSESAVFPSLLFSQVEIKTPPHTAMPPPLLPVDTCDPSKYRKYQ